MVLKRVALMVAVKVERLVGKKVSKKVETTAVSRDGR